MSDSQSAAAPMHLWIVGIISLLWNSMGAFDYYMTNTQNAEYMSNPQFTPELLEWFYSLPTWAVAAWALGVWGGLLGSVLLLLRKKFAVSVFGVSLVGAIGGMINTYFLSNGGELMGTGGAVFSGAIIVVAVFLLVYSRKMCERGVLG
jgi:hypothetical protein